MQTFVGGGRGDGLGGGDRGAFTRTMGGEGAEGGTGGAGGEKGSPPQEPLGMLAHRVGLYCKQQTGVTKNAKETYHLKTKSGYPTSCTCSSRGLVVLRRC